MITLTKTLAALLVFGGISIAAAVADPYGDIAKMGLAYSHASSYRATVQAPKGNVTIEYAAPDKWHMSVGSTMETIAIGSDMWYKVNGSWMHMAGMGSRMQGGIDAAKSMVPTGDYKNDYDVTDLGMKDGYHAYDLRKKGASDHSVIYLRPDSLPAKIEATHGSQTSTITYTDWNTPITISPPQ